MDTYFDLAVDEPTTRQDYQAFKRARAFLRSQKIAIDSQDQIMGVMLSAEDESNEKIADAARTVYELWDSFEE